MTELDNSGKVGLRENTFALEPLNLTEMGYL